MDPNHWNNFNHQAYNRLAAHSGGVPGSTSSLNRYDLPVIDQATISGGLGSTRSSMASHSSLTQQRPLPALPPVNYGHSMHGSVSQFLDSMHSLPPSFVTQPPHKTVSVAPPVSPSLYGLESTIRSQSDLSSSLSHFTASPSSVNPVHKPLLFNTDPISMKETVPMSSGFTNVSSASPVNESPKNWQLSNFLPPPSNPFGNLSADVISNAAGGYNCMVSPDPPPAHSGSRPSTIQRNPYQSSGSGSKLHYAEPTHSAARPAHSPHGHDSFIDSVLRETRSVGLSSSSSSSSLHHSSELPPTAHTGSLGRSSFHHAFMSPRTSDHNPVNPVASTSPTSYSALSNLGSFGTFGALTTASYITTTATASYSSPAIDTAHLDSMNYDPVSPATPAPDSQTTNNTIPTDTGSFHTSMSLQDLPDLNASQDKLSLHERRTMRGSVQASPQHVVNVSALTNSPHHSANMAVPTTSPQHHSGPVNMPKVIDGSSPHTTLQQSPLQASPISVGSPQIPMSMGSPQQSVIGSSTCAPPPQVTVQAVADSTTNKPKRKRGRKKNENKINTPVMNEPITFIPEAPTDVQQPMSIQQPYTPSSGQMSAYDTPPGGNSYDTSPMQQMQQQCQAFESVSHHVPAQPINTSYGQHPQTSVYDNQNLPLTPGLNQAFSPPASSQTPSTPSLSTNSYDSPLALPMVGGNMGTQDRYESKNVVNNDHVFMTNTFGNEFVSPNDVLQMSEVLADAPIPQDNPIPEQVPPPPVKMKHKTKAEQKQMPITYSYDNNIDEEFGHLLVEPQVPGPSGDGYKKPIVHKSPVAPPGMQKPKHQSPNSAFQSSFLSFIQGKKLETLSSVTNSCISKKPQLPKYVPDHRPRVTSRTVKKQPSHDEEKLSDSNSTADSKSIDIPSVTFSDDEDASQNMSKTVQKVISNLSEDSNSNAAPPSSDSLLFSPIKTSANKAHAKRGKRGGKANRGSAVKRGRGKKKYESWDSQSEADPDFQPDVEYSIQSSTAIDPDFTPDVNNDGTITTTPPLRIKVQRKAKSKIEEQRKQSVEKKKKRKKSTLAREEEIQSLSDASISLSEGEAEMLPVSSSEEKDYDSDKDPVWTPFGQKSSDPLQVRAASSGSEDEGGRNKSRGRGRGKRLKLSASKPGRGRGRRRSSVTLVKSPPADVTPANDDMELAHNYQKGHFLIEKADSESYDSFPIWKIDAGRLLQKFEPVLKEGKLYHQALAMYTSWSDSMKSLYKPIKVQSANSESAERVEVLDKYLPKPPVDTSSLENDELMQTFNVYLQILISQALEPGFIDAIRDSGDNADYYLEPFNKIDALIQNRLRWLESKLDWTKEFKESVSSHHCVDVKDLKGDRLNCQACGDNTVKAVKMAQLYGDEYDRETLESKGSSENQDFCIGQKAADQLVPYHALLHFKYTLFKRCVAKSGIVRSQKESLDNSAVVDLCLHNRYWVQKLFMDLKGLIEDKVTKS